MIIFTADLHLTPHIWTKRPELCGDAEYALEQIVDMTIEREATLILGGDLFDRVHPPAAAVKMYTSAMSRLADAGRSVYYIQGNHDYANPSWASVHSWPKPLEQKVVHIEGVRVTGLDYRYEPELLQALNNLLPADILVTHQAWSEIQTIGATQGSLADIPHFHTVLTGDYHVALDKRITRNPTLPGDPTFIVHSPGCIHMTAINENPCKSVLMWDRGQSVRLELQSRLLLTRQIDTAANLQDIVVNLPSELWFGGLPLTLQKPIVRITYNEDIPDVVSRINHAIEHDAHIFWKPYSPSTPNLVDIDIAAANASTSLVAACRELTEDEHSRNVLEQLLTSDDPEGLLNRLREDFVQGVPIESS